MGLRLSSALRQEQKPKNGFDITFTDGITYNLDELVSKKRRDDESAILVVEVKKYDNIARKAIEELKKDIYSSLKLMSDNEEFQNSIQKKLEDTTTDLFDKYNCNYNNITNECQNELNNIMNNFILDIFNKYHLNFSIYFLDSDKINISYNFTNDNELEKKFNEYFSKFSEISNANLDSVEEGGLAISDTAKKIRVNREDYKNYLLKDEESVNSGKTPDNYIYSKLPIVIWEDASEDTTTQDKVYTVYNDIDKIYSELLKHSNDISSLDKRVETIEKK